MRKLLLKLILPITIINFTIFTKWWYVLPTDAPDTMMGGFPLIWISDGWHTSMSLQIFVTEFIINFSVHFIFWFILIFMINRFIRKIIIPKVITILLFVTSGFICLVFVWIGTMPEHVYKANRDFDIEVLATGYKFIWEHRERPKYKDYKSLNHK